MTNAVTILRAELKSLLRELHFASLVVGCIALTIGVSTTLFAAVSGVLLRPLEVRDPHRVVDVYSSYPGLPHVKTSYPTYRDLRDHAECFDGLVAWRHVPFNRSSGDGSERLYGTLASGNFFEALGVEALYGRVFSASEDAAPGDRPVVVVSHRFWRSRLGGAGDAVGRSLRLNGHDLTVVGVMPPGFRGVGRLHQPELWVPLAMQPLLSPQLSLDNRSKSWLAMAGRLRAGWSPEQAQAELERLAEGLRAEHPKELEQWTPTLVPEAGMAPDMRSFLGSAAGLMGTLVAFVLLVACANVAGLLLARGAARRKQVGIRMALGAGRWQVMRQSLLESLALAAVGGVLGWGLARWLCLLLPGLVPPVVGMPASPDLDPDGRVALFALGVTAVAGLVSGLLPALQASAVDPAGALYGRYGAAGQGGRPLRGGLVVLQVTLSVLLLTGGALFVRSLATARAIDPGFATEGLLLADLDLTAHGYDEMKARELYRQLARRLEALPGVESASYSDLVPLRLAGGSMQWGIRIEGYEPEPGERVSPDFNIVGPKYFRTLGIPVLAGREFRPGDDLDASIVMVVNQAMAERYWPGGKALGRRIDVGDGTWAEVVGIVGNSKFGSLGEAPEPFLYVSLYQVFEPRLTLYARAAAGTGAAGYLTSELRRVVREMDASLPVFNVRTMAQQNDESLFMARLAAILAGAFGLLALLLAALGLYALLAQDVESRRREIGIRLAVGGRRGLILARLLARSLVLIGLGLAAGLVAAVLLRHLVERFLIGVGSLDPAAYAAAVAVLLVVTLTAVGIPARRALRLDPAITLRTE